MMEECLVSSYVCVCVLGVVMENEDSTFFGLYKTGLIVFWHTPRDIHKASILPFRAILKMYCALPNIMDETILEALHNTHVYVYICINVNITHIQTYVEIYIYVYISHFSHSVMSHGVYLWLHGLQHCRLPCPSPTLWTCSNSCPSSQ